MIEALITVIESLYGEWGYLIVFLGSLVETSPLGWLIPGGLLSALGGFYSYNGTLNFVGVLVASWFGILSTLIAGYLLGMKIGVPLAKKFKQENNAKKAEKLLEKHGGIILSTTLLSSLTRFWITVVAGSQRFKFTTFLVYASIASLSWSFLLVSVGWLAGTSRRAVESGLTILSILSWLIIIGVSLLLYVIIKKQSKDLEQ